jgi:hypothetical protein
MVIISDGHAVGQREELKARVAWSFPVAGTTEFQAGLQIIHDEPAAVTEMSRLVHRALAVSGKLHAGRNERERDVICWQMRPAQQAPIVVGL